MYMHMYAVLAARVYVHASCVEYRPVESTLSPSYLGAREEEGTEHDFGNAMRTQAATFNAKLFSG